MKQCLVEPYRWGENAFAQNVAKLVVSVDGKTHILAGCWNAQLHSWKNQPVQKPASVFPSFIWPWVRWQLFVFLFHLQEYVSVVMCVCAGFWSEEAVPFWHWETIKQYFLSMLDPSTDADSSSLSEIRVKCPPSAGYMRVVFCAVWYKHSFLGPAPQLWFKIKSSGCLSSLQLPEQSGSERSEYLLWVADVPWVVWRFTCSRGRGSARYRGLKGWRNLLFVKEDLEYNWVPHSD